MAVIGTFYFIDMVLEIVQCIPREKIWNPFLTHGHCLNYTLLFEATGIFNILSDFAIFTLPMPAVWGMRLKLSKKIGLTALFAAGLLCVSSFLLV